MSEQQDVIEEFSEVGALAGVRWAYQSATARSLETYVEADGHDAAWLGNTRFTLFRNRLDRVFACERYAVGSDGDDADLDVLHAQLSSRDVATMPLIEPGVVRRANLNGSPGWACKQRRFLLASCEFGKLDYLPWPQKSPTKQRVALQRDPDPVQPSLFEAFADEEIGGLEAVMAAEWDLDMVTFVVGHTLDPVSQQIELVFGRPQLNAGGGQAWRWQQRLLDSPPAGGARYTDDTPLPTEPTIDAPDASVRMRRPAAKQRRDRANDKQ